MKVLIHRHLAFACLLIGLLMPAFVMAHQTRPVVLVLDSLDNQGLSLSWTLPDTLAAHQFPEISLSSACKLRSGQPAHKRVMRRSGGRIYHCENIAGLKLYLNYPNGNPGIMTMVRGSVAVNQQTLVLAKLFGPGETILELVAENQSFKNTSASTWHWQYLKQGMIHISEGYDHLLFVLCLILIAASPKRIFMSVTGFTAAHSFTLVLTSLNLVTVSVRATETVIALSIIFLAAELARRSRMTLCYKYPVLVAMLIGLVHGLGFASALQEIGLPEHHQLLALMMFNMGVELGQVVFVLLVLPLLYGIKKLTTSELPSKITAYSVGSLASFWLVERLVLS